MKFYSYVTKTPYAPGMEDEPIGDGWADIDRDLKTVRGVVRRRRKAWAGKSFKVFSFTNIYDPKSFRLLHVEVCE